jgi:hypothetical protein
MHSTTYDDEESLAIVSQWLTQFDQAGNAATEASD